MSADGLTPVQRHLLTHAADMSGWLSADLVLSVSEWAEAMPDLTRRGLFAFRPKVPGVHVARYALTGAGHLALLWREAV